MLRGGCLVSRNKQGGTLARLSQQRHVTFNFGTPVSLRREIRSLLARIGDDFCKFDLEDGREEPNKRTTLPIFSGRRGGTCLQTSRAFAYAIDLEEESV